MDNCWTIQTALNTNFCHKIIWMIDILIIYIRFCKKNDIRIICDIWTFIFEFIEENTNYFHKFIIYDGVIERTYLLNYEFDLYIRKTNNLISPFEDIDILSTNIETFKDIKKVNMYIYKPQSYNNKFNIASNGYLFTNEFELLLSNSIFFFEIYNILYNKFDKPSYFILYKYIIRNPNISIEKIMSVNRRDFRHKRRSRKYSKFVDNNYKLQNILFSLCSKENDFKSFEKIMNIDICIHRKIYNISPYLYLTKISINELNLEIIEDILINHNEMIEYIPHFILQKRRFKKFL